MYTNNILLLLSACMIGLLSTVCPLQAKPLVELSDTTYRKIAFEKTIPVTASHLLHIYFATPASVSISGWDKNEVSIKINMEGEGLEVNYTLHGDTIELFSRHQSQTNISTSTGRAEIKVPRQMLILANFTESDLTLNQLQGQSYMETSKGNITGTDISGKINLSTQNGAIELRGGSVNGNLVALQGAVLLKAVKGNISASGQSGNFSVQSPAQVVEASLQANALNLTVKEGDVEASTYQAKLDVTWSGSKDVQQRQFLLSSHEGEIMLRLPKGMSIDVFIEQLRLSEVSAPSSLESDYDMGTLPTEKEFTHQGKKENSDKYKKR